MFIPQWYSCLIRLGLVAVLDSAHNHNSELEILLWERENKIKMITWTFVRLARLGNVPNSEKCVFLYCLRTLGGGI